MMRLVAAFIAGLIVASGIQWTVHVFRCHGPELEQQPVPKPQVQPRKVQA